MDIAAQRPWVRFDASANEGFIDYGGGFRLPIGITLTNIGNTPALDVGGWAVLIGEGKSLDLGKAAEIVSTEGEGIGRSRFPNDPIDDQLFGTLFKEDAEGAPKSADNADHIHIGLLVSVSYRLSGGGVGKTSRLPE